MFRLCLFQCFPVISHKMWRTPWCACHAEKLEEWGDRDLMKYNEDKHKVLHIGRNGPLQPQGAAVLRGHGGCGRDHETTNLSVGQQHPGLY